MSRKRGSRTSRTQEKRDHRINTLKQARKEHKKRMRAIRYLAALEAQRKKEEEEKQKKERYKILCEKRRVLRNGRVLKPKSRTRIKVNLGSGVRAPIDTAHRVVNGSTVWHLVEEL